MTDFWTFLAGATSTPAVLFLASVVLGVGAIFGGAVAIVGGGERVSNRWGWGWNFLYVPFVVALVGFVVIFAAWLGTEVAW